MTNFTTKMMKGIALATGVALLSFSTSASATTAVQLTNSSMDSTYRAYINGSEAYSNGITFGVHEVVSGLNYNLFAFCVDIYHHIGLGDYVPDLNYISNKGDPGEPLTTNFNGTPNNLSTAQKNRVSALVDIGFILNRDAPGAATSLQTAAIQAAIWQTLNPLATISLRTNNLVAPGQAAAYTAAYNTYLTGAVAPGDRIFTLVPNGGNTQSFAVGWPIEGVPEPMTWAMMTIGFFSLGGVLRARRRVLTAV